jgi:uncharacterized protein YcgI (DUF1989 family)
MSELHTIPARKGAAHRMKKGEILRVINTHGSQVVDFWAFNAADLGECMSMEHSRAAILKIIPKAGDTMVTNKRRPILTILEDTSPGVHDTLIAACDVYRYELLGCQGYHDNCTDNLANALQAMGLKRVVMPSPFNLFMNIPVTRENAVSFDPPVTKPGDSITFRAEMDAIVAFSACPQDMVPINGVGLKPTEAHYEIRK